MIRGLKSKNLKNLMIESLPQRGDFVSYQIEAPALLSTLPNERPWVRHRAQADFIEDIYLNAPEDWLKRYSSRMQLCSQLLEYGWKSDADGVVNLKFKRTSFCRVRHCPVCQWRRSLRWKARFIEAAPLIGAAYPNARWIFLTLTVRNCDTENLRDTVQHMAKSWQRFTQRAGWPAKGWIRALEVTHGKDGRSHPHYHCLLMVPGYYFSGPHYLSHEKWQKRWKEAARLDYNPVVDVRVIKDKGEGSTPFEVAASETLKYTVKPSDGIQDAEWFLEMTTQLHKLRGITVGGCLREFMRVLEPDPDEENDEGPENPGGEYFQYSKKQRGYRRLD